MRTLFKAILATVALAAPLYANAIPMTWNYSGSCSDGDCDIVPTITGRLIGDPTLRGPSDELNEPLFLSGDLFSYEFWIGDFHLFGNGATAVGHYDLDSNNNISSGSMTFGNADEFQLQLLDVGSTWSIFVVGCEVKCFTVDASGRGAYTVPEPATLSLLGLGLLGFGLIRRRRVG